MRRLPTALVLAATLLAGCTGGTPDAGPGRSPAPSGSPAAVDAFTALAPPADTRVGNADPLLSARAFEKTRGLLALSLAEPGVLTGSSTGDLVELLRGPDPALSVEDLLVPRPTQKALGLRPLFARTVTLADRPVEVVRSSYRGEQVRGLGGEEGLRISWDGAVRYRVLVGGRPHEVGYALQVSYVFLGLANEPTGLQLVQAVPGTFHAAPVVTSCLAKGVLLPAAGAPTEADLAPSPWPAPAAGPACPV